MQGVRKVIFLSDELFKFTKLSPKKQQNFQNQ